MLFISLPTPGSSIFTIFLGAKLGSLLCGDVFVMSLICNVMYVTYLNISYVCFLFSRDIKPKLINNDVKISFYSLNNIAIQFRRALK